MRKRDCQNIRTMDFLKLLCQSDRIQASKRERERERERERWGKRKMLELKANYLSKDFANPQVIFVCGHFQHMKYVHPPWVN